ncbi:Zinc finger HIT domain-containing protein 2 [Phytophthora boehmeriae]|uniref:Zinc finger HIT domain-containing protein 2 n=1 Tax=Phytophthora boehmeriae TaxID=109152 RepID=A0A8T1X253_9STRA|nr:Zinc finger HIT domain-containing protein 2 [Phytophthora boehmeriae]
MKLNSTARGDDQRQQQRSIQELLERVKEFQDEHQTAEDEDEEALVERMQELAMLDAAGELTLESLTSEERKKFLGEVADGRLGKLVQLWSPWWLLSERKYRYETSARRKQILMEEISSSNEVEGAESEIPQVVTVESTVLFPVGLFTDRDSKKMPKSMKNLLPGGKHPSPCLRFHLVEVLFAYALVLRAFNGDYAQDVAEAALMLLDVCKVLSADARYETVGHVCLACLEKQSSDEATVNTVALQDAQNLLQTHIFILDALNDTHILLEKYQRELEDSREKKGKKERKAAIKRLHIVLKKLQFYQTWAFLTSDDEFQQLAAEIEVYMKERKMLRAQ